MEKEKRISEIKYTKNISYSKSRKAVQNSLVTTTYANVAKSTNNLTQNQGLIPNEMINLLKELKTLIELLRDQPDNQDPHWTRSKEEHSTLD